jgi:Zn-dependent M28 family amino/carboxypeptidase
MNNSTMRLELDKAIIGEAMVSDHGVDVLRELCDDVDNRFAGSAGERKAGDLLLARMEQAGLANVHAEPFRLLSWKRGRKPVLKVLGPRLLTVPAIALPFSPPTREDGLELEMINLGEGMPEDFRSKRRKIKGRAVMVSSASAPGYYRGVHRAEKYARAVDAGAKAFIFMNHGDGMLEATGSIRFGWRGEIPGLGVARETGFQMLRFARDGGPLRIQLATHDQFVRTESRNIVGELVGRKAPKEVVIVCGHYDGHDISQAAEDNGSGTATIVEAARLLAPHAHLLDRTVRFICFGSEEIGLIGSARYVKKHASELPRIRLVVNVDCIGNSRGKGFNFHGWDEAKPLVAKMSGEMSEGIGFASRPNAYSDHFNFLAHGVPNCGLGSFGGGGGRGYGHTRADSFDKVSRADLRESACLLARSLIRIANDPQWALPHKPIEEVKAMLERYEILTVKKIEGTLPDVLK